MQSSGAIDLGTARTHFGSGFNSLNSLYGVASGVPSSGAISLSHLYGKSASTPSVSGIGNQNVNTSSSSQSLTLGTSGYVSDTYGAPFTYSINSFNSSHVSSASVNSGGTLSYTVAYNKFANTTNILVTVTNRFGRTATITVPLYVFGVGPSVTSGLGNVSLGNNSYNWYLPSYFSDSSGTTLSYSLTSNPYSSASISSSYLYVYANYRNTSYTVTVAATNGYGQSTSLSTTITETAAPVSLTYNPTYTNWYTAMSRYGNVYSVVQSGSDPNVQLQMNSASVNSSITHVYAVNRLQDFSTAEIEFDIYISSSAVADALFFYMGYNSVPNNSYYEGVNSVAYQLNIEIYQWAGYTRGFHLIKNGSTSAVASYSTTSHIASTWYPVKVVWNKSSTNTFQIYFNGTNIINYSDASFASFVSGSGSYWGIGSRTGGATGDMWIRRVRVGTPGYVYTATLTGGSDAQSFCSGWTSYCQNLGTGYSTVIIRGSSDTMVRSCTNSTIVANIASNLKAGTAYSAYDSATGFTWVTGSCGAETRTLSATGSVCNCDGSPAYVYRPCINVNNPNWGGAGTVSCSAPTQTITITFM